MRRARGFAPLDYSSDDAELVHRIVLRARDAGPGHVAVFDLDGCLFDTRQRQVQILWEMASRLEHWPLYRVREEHFVDWDLARTMRNAGIDESWVDAHKAEVRDFWWDRFFSSDYVVHDLAMPGAAAVVRAVHAAGLHVVYLTGRDETMRAGTEIALTRSGFPTGLRADLVMKPEAKLDDTAFKEHALEAIAKSGDIVLYLDNEPANVNMYRRRHPDALVVFLETDHSPLPIEPDPAIPWLRSFLPRAL